MAGEAVAQVMFLLLGGVLADRFSRYRLMVGSDLLACAAQGSIAGLFISGAAPLGLVAALAAVTGAASGIFYPSSRGLIPQIVDGPQLQSANAADPPVAELRQPGRCCDVGGDHRWRRRRVGTGGRRGVIPGLGGIGADLTGTQGTSR